MHPERARFRQLHLWLAAFFACLLPALGFAFVRLNPLQPLQGDLFHVRQVLAHNGGIELTTDSPSLPEGVSHADVLLTANGTGCLTVTGQKVDAVLLVNERWWLHFPKQHLTLVGRDDLAAFNLGDLAASSVIPPLAPWTFDPNILFLVAWKLPDWGSSDAVKMGWKFIPKKGHFSLIGIHDPKGVLTSLEVKGLFPHDAALELQNQFLSATECRQRLATPVDFTAPGTKVEEVPTALLQKSVYGTMELFQKDVSL